MRKRWLLILLAIATVLTVVVLVPFARDLVFGLVSGEPFHDGLPLRYWLRTLRSTDAQARERAAHVLGEVGPGSDEVLPTLTEALGDESYIVRRNAAEALGRIGGAARSTAPALIAALKDADVRVRWGAARALGRIQPDAAAAVPALLVLARSERDAPTRDAAIVSIGNLGTAAESAIPELIDMLKEAPGKEGNAAEAARGALQQIGKGAVEPLITACGHKNSRVRAGAAQTLADMSTAGRAALPALQLLLHDPDAAPRLHAAAALWKLDGQVENTVPVLVAVVNASNRDARLDAMVALGNMGSKAAASVDALQKSLADKDYAIRSTAVKTLAKIGRPALPATGALETVARTDREPEVRHAAAVAVEAIRAAK